MSRRVVAAVSDLFFIAKLKEAARHAGVALELTSSGSDLLEKAGSGAALVILDLNDPTVDNVESIRRLRLTAETASVPILAFLSHVQRDLAERARAAGCERVVARSQLSARLVDFLRGE